ncbi:unnamed protein product [Mucor hiemalis]
MSKLDTFLDHVRQELRSNAPKVHSNVQHVHLNSIISSLLFAYISHFEEEAQIYVPLIKVPKADLELRPELKYVLETIGLDYKKLITIDEIDTSQATDIVLVDHNHLTAPLNTEDWTKHVVGVLDHHLYLDAPMRVIDMVGSCVTLVLKQFKVNASSPWLDEDIARLAMAPLLVDTVNLKWDLGRTTEADVQVYNILSSFVTSTQEQSTDGYFKAIEKVKSQVDAMSNYDILRRDYKEFSDVNGYRIGTSAVTWNFNAWVKREDDSADNIVNATMKYAQERELDMEVIFTAFDYDREGAGDYHRELAIFVINPDLLAVKKSLEENKELELKPIRFKGSENEFYEQGNVKMSRKQVWPLLKQLITNKSQL